MYTTHFLRKPLKLRNIFCITIAESSKEMVIQDILYVALSTILVMVVLQVATFIVTRMLYPPEPKVVYRDVPVYTPAPVAPAPPPINPLFPPASPPSSTQNGPVLTQTQQEVQLPEYEPRKPASTSVRMDPELPAGLQETRPPGT
jgi:hypothetical protein